MKVLNLIWLIFNSPKKLRSTWVLSPLSSHSIAALMNTIHSSKSTCTRTLEKMILTHHKRYQFELELIMVIYMKWGTSICNRQSDGNTSDWVPITRVEKSKWYSLAVDAAMLRNWSADLSNNIGNQSGHICFRSQSFRITWTGKILMSEGSEFSHQNSQLSSSLSFLVLVSHPSFRF